MGLESAKSWLEVATSLGLIVLLGALGKWFWDRRRWHRFENSIRAWARDETFSVKLSSDEWTSLVAIKLSDAGFTPAETLALLDLGVAVAKGHLSIETRGRIQE